MISKTYLKKISLVYSIIIGSFLVLSLISLFFNEPVVIGIFGISGIFGYISLYIFVLQNHTGDSTKFLVYIILRYIVMAIGIALSCLLVLVTMGNNTDINRYFLVVLGGIVYLAPLVCFLVVKE